MDERQPAAMRCGRAMLSALGVSAVLLAAAPALADEPKVEYGERAFPEDEMGPNDPLAGFNDGVPFLRSADNTFIFKPDGRLQTDLYLFARPTNNMPNDTFLLKRARLAATGWMGKWFHYYIEGDFALAPPASADPVAQSFLAATDDFVAVAPFGDRVILQVGQYDAPFTMENRTSDKYIDFMERSVTIRSFGIPAQKAVGMMLHGKPLENDLVYYSLAVINGDGQNFKNVDNNFDFMGRLMLSPFALTPVDALKKVSVGASVWYGTRASTGLAFASQTTQAGFTFFNTSWTSGLSATTPMQLHEDGYVHNYAFEVNVPIAHRFGARFEYVNKKQALDEDDITNAASGKLVTDGHATFSGWSCYGEAYAWILGDDTILPEPGTELPLNARLRRFKTLAPRHGLMLAARVDNLQETVSSDTPALKDPTIGTTHIIAPEVGVNYWYNKRFRASFNYILNIMDGGSATISSAKTKNGVSKYENEYTFRLAVAM